MKNTLTAKISLALLAPLLFIGSTALAESTSPLIYDNVNIRPLVEYFRKEVLTVKHPFTVYNWTPAGEAYDQGARKIANRAATSFWISYGRNTSGAMFGNGLYAAADPAATLDYGGYNGKFLLTVMNIPAGVKMIDVSDPNSMNTAVPDDVKTILGTFDCNQAYTRDLAQTTYSLFNTGGSSLPQKCQELVKKVFKDVLQIQAFAYSYSRSQMKLCEGQNMLSSTAGLATRAFVITDNTWMDANNVKYYTANTKDQTAERTHIMSYILTAKSGSLRATIPADITAPIGEFLMSHPDHQLKGSATDCDKAQCVMNVEFCDSTNQCEKIKLAPILRPGGPNITKEEFSLGFGPRDLLWSDLEGVPKSATIGTWIQANSYMCNGKVPFEGKK